MWAVLEKFFPGSKGFQESAIFDAYGERIGWHSTLVSQEGIAISGGCGVSLELARRIAICEAIERGVFFALSAAEKQELNISAFPTTCGFAAGFEDRPARYRAIAEAVERWAWSKWIDDGFSLARAEFSNEVLSPIGKHLKASFDEVIFLEKKITLAGGSYPPLKLGITLGFLGSGVFPGSRLGAQNDDLWTHGLLEAWRHKVIADDLKKCVIPFGAPAITSKRILHFANNGTLVRKHLNFDSKDPWPDAELAFEKPVLSAPPPFFMWRALCKNFVGWHLGGVDRFVY